MTAGTAINEAFEITHRNAKGQVVGSIIALIDRKLAMIKKDSALLIKIMVSQSCIVSLNSHNYLFGRQNSRREARSNNSLQTYGATA